MHVCVLHKCAGKTSQQGLTHRATCEWVLTTSRRRKAQTHQGGRVVFTWGTRSRFGGMPVWAHLWRGVCAQASKQEVGSVCWDLGASLPTGTVFGQAVQNGLQVLLVCADLSEVVLEALNL